MSYLVRCDLLIREFAFVFLLESFVLTNTWLNYLINFHSFKLF